MFGEIFCWISEEKEHFKISIYLSQIDSVEKKSDIYEEA